jgi:hypothetical protein
LAVIQRSAFRDEGSLFDFDFLPGRQSANFALVVILLALTQRSERSEGSTFYAEGITLAHQENPTKRGLSSGHGFSRAKKTPSVQLPFARRLREPS